MIRFKCDTCNASLKASDDYQGKRIRCSKCKNIVNIPAAPGREIVEVGCGDTCANLDALLQELSQWENQAPAVREGE